MLGAVIPALDLSALLRFACTALAVIATAFVLIKKAASKYFVVDAGFGVSEEFHSRNHMPIGGGGCGCDAVGVGVTGCAVCTRSASKKCSRCKSIWYCSQECQTKHWIEEHNSKCRALEKFDTCRTGARRKSSAISLVPDQGSRKVLKKPKKILFPYDEFVKLFDWDKPDFPPCGLLNCGNSCFANVVLQCLASTRPLVAYLLEKDHNRGCSSRDDWCFLCELQIHIKRASESLQPFSPVNILSRLPNIGGNFGYGRQEDAHEFMRFAIDTMQSVCLNEYGGEKAVEPSTQETTIVQYIFGGHLQSQVICTNCDVVSKRYENMMDLTVEIHGDSESLEECLDQFTVKEWLDGENKYKCDGCNAYVKAWKRLTVHQAPNVLTVTLKRFQSGRFGKLNKRVTFPEHLDLSPYLSSASGDGSDRYTLYGVVVHLDMLNASFFGHYICYTKDSQGLWYRVDDCKVARVEVEEVLAQGAYMLLYHRNTPRKDPFVKPVELNLKTPMTQDSTRPASSSFSCSYSPCAVSMPAATKLRPNDSDFEMPCNISSLRDTGHDRQPNENESANDVESEAEASRDESRMEAGDGSSADKDVIMEEAPSNADSPTPSADTANGTRSEQIWLTSPANGSGAKMKPIFARGFLDRGMPAGRKKGAPAGKPNGHLAFDYGNAEKCSPANGDCGGVPSFKRERRCSLPNGEPSLDVRSCTSGSNGVDCSRDLKHSNGF